MNKNYVVFIKKGKYWFSSKYLCSKEKAKEVVKGLKENGNKAYYTKVN